MKQALYFFIILQFILAIAWINIYIPLCPNEYIAHIAFEQYCNCYLWNILVDTGVTLFTLWLLFLWERYYLKHYPIVLYFFIAIFNLVVIRISLDAINGLVGTIGPNTMQVASLWRIGDVLAFYSLLYFFLVLKVSKSYKSKAFVVAVLLYIFSMWQIIEKFLDIIYLSQ